MPLCWRRKTSDAFKEDLMVASNGSRDRGFRQKEADATFERLISRVSVNVENRGGGSRTGIVTYGISFKCR